LELTKPLTFLKVALIVMQLFFLVMVCHLTKMAHFVPCHKEITAEESADLFISNCYKLHGVPKVIVSDRDPKIVGKFWQSFMGNLNTKLNTSTARHPRTDRFVGKSSPNYAHIFTLLLCRIWFRLDLTLEYGRIYLQLLNHQGFSTLAI